MGKRLKGEWGYALLWAVMIMLIAVIIISATLLAGNAYAARNLSDAITTQAYLTARSAAEVIASQINGTTAICEEGAVPQYDNPLIPADNGRIDIDGASFDFPGEMGAVAEASITRNGDEIRVGASAIKGEETRTVEIVFTQTMSTLLVPLEDTEVQLTGFVGLYAGTKLYFDKNNTKELYFQNGDVYAANLKFPGKKELEDLIVDGTFYLDNPSGWRSRLGEDVDLQEYPGDLPFVDTTEFLAPANYIGGQIVIDLANTSGTYFELSDSTQSTTKLKVAGNDVYIAVPANKTLYLNVDVVSGSPRIFVVVAGTLYINDPDDALVYAYGKSGSQIYLADGLTISGAIHGEEVTLLGDLDFTFVDPLAEGDAGDQGSGFGTTVTMEVYRWDATRYVF
jgi:hypothetical protein